MTAIKKKLRSQAELRTTGIATVVSHSRQELPAVSKVSFSICSEKSNVGWTTTGKPAVGTLLNLTNDGSLAS